MTTARLYKLARRHLVESMFVVAMLGGILIVVTLEFNTQIFGEPTSDRRSIGPVSCETVADQNTLIRFKDALPGQRFCVYSYFCTKRTLPGKVYAEFTDGVVLRLPPRRITSTAKGCRHHLFRYEIPWTVSGKAIVLKRRVEYPLPLGFKIVVRLRPIAIKIREPEAEPQPQPMPRQDQ